MPAPESIALALLIFAAALLYSTVGHGGASAYLAAMALFSLPVAVMKPTALALNILVAGIATFRFAAAGHFAWSTFLPFAVTSIPLAFVGGALPIAPYMYKPLVGIVLLYAAYRLLRNPVPIEVRTPPTTIPVLPAPEPHVGSPPVRETAVEARNAAPEPTLVAAPDSMNPAHRVPLAPALALGAAIGLLSGATGVGGGIFLSPLLLFMNWATPRRTAATSAAFILVNSISGIAGHLLKARTLPAGVLPWAVAAVLGGLIGAELGSRRIAPITFRRLLAIVLVIAGAKLLGLFGST